MHAQCLVRNGIWLGAIAVKGAMSAVRRSLAPCDSPAMWGNSGAAGFSAVWGATSVRGPAIKGTPGNLMESAPFFPEASFILINGDN